MLEPIEPPVLVKDGVVFLLKIKNISSRDIGKEIDIELIYLGECESEMVIWRRVMNIKDSEVLIVIDKVLKKGEYLIKVRYRNSFTQRKIFISRGVIYIGVPYSSYPPLELFI